MSTLRKSWVRLAAVLLVVCIILFAPYKSTTSPEWSIQVVDEKGQPISGLNVTEEWSYFGIDFAASMDDKKTDVKGRVNFPRRIIWASLASRALNLESATPRVGPSVWVLACDDAQLMQGEVFWDGTRFGIGPQTKEARIVAKPVKYCTMM